MDEYELAKRIAQRIKPLSPHEKAEYERLKAEFDTRHNVSRFGDSVIVIDASTPVDSEQLERFYSGVLIGNTGMNLNEL